MLYLIVWLLLTGGISLGLKAGIDGALGKLVASWWVFAAGVLTFVICWWLVAQTYFSAGEPEVTAFGVCGTLLVLAGTVLVPLELCKLVDRD